MTSPRTLIVGLDGATFDLIEPLVRAGHLPALARIMAEGVYGRLKAWPNMNSAAAWSSIVTGYNPGQHGIYEFGPVFTQFDTEWHPTTGADRRKDPFWRLLSAAGQRVGIVNVPITYPADPINGFMLAGLDAPFVHSRGFAHPPDLPDELRREGIDYVIDTSNLGMLSRRSPHQLPRAVPEMIDARARTIPHLMQAYPWDMSMAVFVAPDRVQHHYWPHNLSSVENGDWTPIRHLYQQIDSFLATALELIDENTSVLLISDHGFQTARTPKRSLNALFQHLGLLRYRHGGSRLKSSLLRNMLRWARRTIPPRPSRVLTSLFPRLARRAFAQETFSGIDWPQTKVFAFPPGWEVLVNLQGRQPEGIVRPEEYDPLCERVRDILMNLTDSTSGDHVVQSVKRREDLYHGPYQDRAPDLIIEWNNIALRDDLCYREGKEQVIIETPKSSRPGRYWTGIHDQEGIFVARGPHIRKGAPVLHPTLYDIAPTILYLQDHPIPADMDGKVLTDMFTQDHLRRQPIRRSEPTTIGTGEAQTALGDEEERQIEERLRGLGYIE